MFFAAGDAVFQYFLRAFDLVFFVFDLGKCRLAEFVQSVFFVVFEFDDDACFLIRDLYGNITESFAGFTVGPDPPFVHA